MSNAAAAVANPLRVREPPPMPGLAFATGPSPPPVAKSAESVPASEGVSKQPTYTRLGGRPAGSPNKFTMVIKQAIEWAFNEAGGREYLLRVALTEPKAFIGLLTRVLPKDLQISGPDGAPLGRGADVVEVARRIAHVLREAEELQKQGVTYDATPVAVTYNVTHAEGVNGG